MRKTTFTLLCILTLGALSGCVFRANIPQGNIVEQEDVDQLEIGMTRNQVRFLLGTPMVDVPARSLGLPVLRQGGPQGHGGQNLADSGFRRRSRQRDS